MALTAEGAGKGGVQVKLQWEKIVTWPNLITSIRIAGAVALIWILPFSPLFYGVYLICGLSDGLDGMVARLTKQTSDFGRLLDSVADLAGFSKYHFSRLFKKQLGIAPSDYKKSL